MQLERSSHSRIDDKWKTLEKKAKREAKKVGEGFLPPEQRPESKFVASLIDEFVEVISSPTSSSHHLFSQLSKHDCQYDYHLPSVRQALCM